MSKFSKIQIQDEVFKNISLNEADSAHEGISSKYLQLYNQLLEPYSQTKKAVIKAKLQQKISQNGIKYQQTDFSKALNITINSCSLNKQVLVLHVHYANFTIPLTVLNTIEVSKNHRIGENYCGSFATTYKGIANNKEIAIKCHQIRTDFQIIFKNVVRQFCLLKIASILEAGPRIENIFGFDIIVFQDCIEFSMEFGVNTLEKLKHDILVRDLKQALRKMHLFNFVHVDIKWQNICYSPSLQKYVFIDFGLSSILAQKFGLLTFTNFRGSFQFCSPQMQECYLMNIPNYVDLYYNDCHCLRITIFKVSEYIKNYSQEQVNKSEDIAWIQEDKSWNIPRQNIIILCKYHLYFITQLNHFKSVKQLFHRIQPKLLVKYFSKLISYMQNLDISTELEDVYRQFFSLSKTEETRHQFFHFRHRKIYKNKQIIYKQDSQLSLQRFQIISNIGYFELDNKRFDIKAKQSIINQIQLRQFSTDKNYIIIADQIQINNSTFSVRQKVKVCQIFNTIFVDRKLNVQKKLADERILQITIEFLLDFSFSAPITRIKQELIYKLLPSLFILQIKTEQKILEYFKTIWIFQLSNLSKLRLATRFLSSLVWVKQKYFTTYSMNKLESNILKQAHSQLINISEHQNIYCCYFLLQIIRKKRGLTCQDKITSYTDKNYFCGCQTYTYFQKQLLQEIIIFCLHYQLEIATLTNKPQQHLILRKLQKIIWNKKNQQNKTFQYYHFLIYNIYLKYNIDSVFLPIYDSFFKIFSHYPFINCYKMSISFLFSQFKTHKICYNLLMRQFKKIIKICNTDAVLTIIANIAHAVSSVSEKMNQDQINFLKCIYQSENIIKTIKKQRLASFQIQHKHWLPQVTEIMVNLFIILYCQKQISEQTIKALQHFQMQLTQLLDMQQCLDCKYRGLLKYMPIMALKYQINQNWKDIVQLYISLVIACLKFQKLTNQIIIFTNFIIQICYSHHYLLQTYQPFIFQYECIKAHKVFEFYLTEMTNYPRLFYLYHHLCYYSLIDDLIDLVMNLLLVLSRQFSTIFIYNFHKVITLTVNANKDNHNFFKLHQQVIEYLKNKSNCYVGLYFTILLSFSTYKKTEVINLIFVKISQSLNFIDSYSRAIILSLFYEQFVHYSSCNYLKERRKFSLIKKHLKYSVQQYSIVFIIQNKIKLKRYCDTNFKKLKDKLKDYHGNIQNLKQEVKGLN